MISTAATAGAPAVPFHRRYQLLTTLRLWHDRTLALKEAWDTLNSVAGLSPESMLSHAVWTVHAEYTRTVAREIGDTAEWMDWWHYECDLGKAPRDATRQVGGAMRPVTTIDELLDVILGDAP